jgi:hypothetical protein
MTGPGTNTGHGHVWPRPDGAKARCGGPTICPDCARALATRREAEKPDPDPDPVWDQPDREPMEL